MRPVLLLIFYNTLYLYNHFLKSSSFSKSIRKTAKMGCLSTPHLRSFPYARYFPLLFLTDIFSHTVISYCLLFISIIHDSVYASRLSRNEPSDKTDPRSMPFPPCTHLPETSPDPWPDW